MLLLGAAAVLGQGKPQMPTDVGAGRVAWFDISTGDLARAQEFYRQMFDWTFEPVVGTRQAVQVVSRGLAIGTIRSADGPISRFNGVVYVQVDDVRNASAKAAAIGATVAPGFPFNLPNGTGAISLILDPSGHPLGLYSRARIPEQTP
ncbi:MAG TPA: VOC family protein [Vicinamibacterales bacterium]|nr:VOC family protein [Vicinamibacterales bacterium]